MIIRIIILPVSPLHRVCGWAGNNVPRLARMLRTGSANLPLRQLRSNLQSVERSSKSTASLLLLAADRDK